MRLALLIVFIGLTSLACGSPMEGIWAGSCDIAAGGVNLDFDALQAPDPQPTIDGGGGAFEFYSGGVGQGGGQGRVWGDGVDSEAPQITLVLCADKEGCTDPTGPWDTDDIYLEIVVADANASMVATGAVVEKGRMEGTCWWTHGADVSTGELALVHRRTAPADR